MPEWIISGYRFVIEPIKRRPNLSDEALAWQKENESTWAEASRDPEVVAVRKDCPYGCGWWTMAVAEKGDREMANVTVQLDIGRHLFHDCKKIDATVKANIGPRPRPSH